jgi:isochorismate synthase
MRAGSDHISIGKKIEAKDLIHQILGLGGSLMYWRLPNTNEKTLIICNSGASIKEEITLEGVMPSFAFAPFDPAKGKYLFTADLVFRFKNDELVDGPDLNNTPFFSKTVDVEYSQKPKPHVAHDRSNTPATNFKELVEACIQKTESKQVEKIVPSKFKDVDLPENFDVVKTFNRLCEKHPNAFVSLVTSPETGTWLGASPELLVSVDAEERFRTIALAGTQQAPPNVNLKAVAWTQKEIEEQALVSRYIINCFKKIRVREYAEHGPHTVVAGSLLHLRSDYEVNTREINFPQLGSVMLKLLHPTSAVCGMPFDNSFGFLQQNEGYDREFYSGFLGPVNFDNESRLFVNLRCMQIFESTARIYAGAGVTADSVAEHEVEEVDMKIKTLSQLLNS